MKKIKNNQLGFGTVEIILVVIIIALIGVVGWLVYKNQHKTTSTTSSYSSKSSSTSKTTSTAPSQPTSPYAGWKTYVLPVEKLSFMYPPNWTVNSANTNQLTSTQDQLELDDSSTGFTFSVSDGNGNGGDNFPEASSAAVPVTFLGQSDYFVPAYGVGSFGQGSSDGMIAGAFLQTSTSNNGGPNGGWPWPKDRTAYQSNPQYGGGPVLPGDPTDYFIISIGFKPQLTLGQFATNTDLKDAQLVIQSAHY